MECCRKAPYMLPWVGPMSQTITVNVCIIYCQCAIDIVRSKGVRALVLIANDFPTHSGVFYSLDVKICRRAATSIDVHSTQSFGAGQCFKPRRTCAAGVGHIDAYHFHPSSLHPTTRPLHITVCLNRLRAALQPVVS